MVVAVAVAVGFRPSADALAWFAAVGIILLFAFALVWLATALGLAAKSVETASNTPMFLTLLPFLGSGFVPTATMPEGLRQFAEYQPFTPVTETLRGLLTGTGIGTNADRRGRVERRYRSRLLSLGPEPLRASSTALTTAF